MFSEDQKIIQRIAPALQRILVVDPQPSSARMLADLLRSLFPCQVWIAPTKAKAAELMQATMPQIVFVELEGPDFDGVAFTRQLRRSNYACRQVPVIMATATATAQSILAARDCGVHEFLRKPYTTKDLLRRLEAVALKPRPWIEAVGYVGPDRRRFNSGAYAGPRKRGMDHDGPPEAARIAQSFKILRAASLALSADPVQALRSMRAQAGEIYHAAIAQKDAALAAAAADFHRHLAQVRQITPQNSPELLVRAQALLALAPADAAPPARAPAREAA